MARPDFPCLNCGSKLTVDPSLIGKNIICQGCEQQVRVPAPATAITTANPQAGLPRFESKHVLLLLVSLIGGAVCFGIGYQVSLEIQSVLRSHSLNASGVVTERTEIKSRFVRIGPGGGSREKVTGYAYTVEYKVGNDTYTTRDWIRSGGRPVGTRVQVAYRPSDPWATMVRDPSHEWMESTMVMLGGGILFVGGIVFVLFQWLKGW